jgi:ribosomal protein S18 acetylase RimI-like enzyme
LTEQIEEIEEIEQIDRFGPATASPTAAADHVLDHAAWASLTGHHARFAQRHGRAMRYHPDVAPFVALEDEGDPRAWEDVADLLDPQDQLPLSGVTQWPEIWKPLFTADAVQMIGTRVNPRPDPEAVLLGADDVPEILELVARTEPGPFLPRTVELGTYLGIRRDGALVAMAGERLHPPGWTEISAVCTDAEYRGQGLASRLVRAVAAGVIARGERPFLHAVASNTNAIRLYESLGFDLRRATTITLLSRS